MSSPEGSKSLYPTLRGGPGGIGRSRTERHQRGRLEGAMVAAVAQHGYAKTTVGELVGLAGVSKSTFYKYFASKQECFLVTFDTIVAEATERVTIAYRSGTSMEERFVAAFTKFAEIVAEESAAASLVVVDSLSLGAAALEHRARAAEAFEMMFHQSFRSESGEAAPSPLTVRAIVAGLRRVVYRCLRAECPEEVREHVEELRRWALSYGLTEMPSLGQLPPPPQPRAPIQDPVDALDWEEPPDSPRSRAELTQRERIVRAAVQIAADRGYATLTIPAISAAAGTSNQTFYEHFADKEEAFVAGFEELARSAGRATTVAAATKDEWRSAIEAGVRGLLSYIAGHRLFARIAFFELPVAGPAALDRADALAKRFTAFLEPEALPRELAPLPPVVIEAIGGGMWAAIQHEIAAGNVAALPTMAPEITAISLAPLRPRRPASLVRGPDRD